MSHHNLQGNVEDAAYLNLYPVAFQARGAMLSAMSLPEVVIPAEETRRALKFGAPLSGREYPLFDAF